MGSEVEKFTPLQYSLLNWLVTVPALLITALRLVVRFRQLKTLQADDYFAIAAAACLLVLAIIAETQRPGIYLLIDLFAGVAPVGITLDTFKDTINQQLKLQFVFVIIFWTCLWSVKGSLMMFYRRLLVGLEGHIKWWWMTVALCITTFLVSFLTNFLACLPLSKRFTLDTVTCPLDQSANVLRAATALDVLTDVLIILLPLRLLSGLRISVKQKIGIGCIFGLGFLCIAFSLVRMAQVAPLVLEAKPTAEVSLACWSMIECSIAVIIASLPPLKVLFTSHRRDTSYHGGNKSKSTNRSSRSANKSNESRMGPSIRLHNMHTRFENAIEGGFGSEEELKAPRCHQRDVETGISKTLDVEVKFGDRQPTSPNYGNDDGIESFRIV